MAILENLVPRRGPILENFVPQKFPEKFQFGSLANFPQSIMFE